MTYLTFTATAVLIAITGLALASGPVPRTMTGCIMNGEMTSQDGYAITVLDRANRRINLMPYNGRRIAASGNLLPGDRFYPDTPFRILGPCR